MALIPSKEDVKVMEEAVKMKVRAQMLHDLCVLAAGGGALGEGSPNVENIAARSMKLYKELFNVVVKEIP